MACALKKTGILLGAFAFLAAFPVFGSQEASEAPSCSLLYAGTLGISSEEEQAFTQAVGDFFKLPKVNPEITAERNAGVLKALREEKLPASAGSKRDPSLTRDQIQKLYEDIMDNPQVVKSLCGKYNGSPVFGYCWGRAMAAHLKALQTNLSNKSIRKIWAVGDLKNGSTKWRYHVTTAVRGDDGSWYAIDPIFGKVMTVDEWHAKMRDGFDPDKTMRLFATPAKRYSPTGWNKYSKQGLANETYYYGFFADLLDRIHLENTGRVGSWRKVMEEAAGTVRWKRTKNILLKLGLGGPPAFFTYEFIRILTTDDGE